MAGAAKGMNLQFQQFGGLNTAFDAESVSAMYSTDNRNCDTQKGLDQRLGYASANFTGTLSGIEAVRGFYELEGYDDSKNLVQEYVAFLKSGGVLKPYSINVTTGARTEIKDGTTALSLTDAEWQMFTFQGQAYAFTPGGPIYVHDIGDATSWTALDPGQPNQFTTGNFPYLLFEQTEEDPVADTSGSFAGFGAGNRTWTGASTLNFVSETGGVVRLSHVWAGGAFNGTMKLEFPGGPVNFSNASELNFKMYREDGQKWLGLLGDHLQDMAQDWYIEDSGGVQVLCSHAIEAVQTTDGDWEYRIKLTIPVASRGGAVASAVDKITVSGTFGPPIEAPSSTEDFFVTSVTSDKVGAAPAAPDQVGIRFGAVAYNETMGIEAANPTFSKEVRMSIDDASRYYEKSAANALLGEVCTVQVPSAQVTTLQSATGVTHIRYYVAFMDEGTESSYTMRLMGVQEVDAVNAGTYEVPYTYEELRALPLRVDPDYQAVGNVVAAAAYRQWVVYGIKGGSANVRHSAVNRPRLLAKITDNADPDADFVDLYRAADFTLADNFADEAMAFIGMGNSIIILGNNGVYVQTGDTPITMRPPKKISDYPGLFAPGCAVRWKDAQGRPAVVYLDTTGERLWMITYAQLTDTENDELAMELSYPIRGSILSKLFAGTRPVSLSDKQDVRLVADWRNDRMYLCNGLKWMVYDKLPFGQRYRPFLYWEFAAPAVGATFKRIVASNRYGVRALLSNGAVREMFHTYSSGAFTALGGALRDGGIAPPATYWQGPVFSGQMRRAVRVQVEKRAVSESGVTVQITATAGQLSESETITIRSNIEMEMVHPTIHGLNMQHRFTLPDNSAGLYRINVQEQAVSAGYSN